MKQQQSISWRLGMFVIVGLALLLTTIYYIGKSKNLFGSTFHVQVHFKTVSGLKIGNNVRFSGINVGTITEIELITDTSVMVELVIRKKYQEFIKTDAVASIGSDGLMGDKILTIYPGTNLKSSVKSGDLITSKNGIEIEDVMSSLKASVDNAGIITAQLAMFSTKMNNGDGALSKLISDEEFSTSLKNTLVNLQTSSNEFAEFTTKMNDGKGAFSKLMTDEEFGNSLDSTMSNLQGATKGLNENMEAAQNNFLLKGFFNKKKKEEEKKLAELKRLEDLKKKIELKKLADAKKKNNLLLPAINKIDTLKN